MKKFIKIFIFILILIFIIAVRHYNISISRIVPVSIEEYQKEQLNENVLFFRNIETDELVGKKLEYDYIIDTVDEVFELLTAKANTLPIGYSPSISPSTNLIGYNTDGDKLTINLSDEFNNSRNIDNSIEELYVNYYILGYKRLSIEVNGSMITDGYINESVVDNRIYDEITVTSIKSVMVVKESIGGYLIPQIHIVNKNISLIDYLYEQYKEYISMMDVVDDTITINTYSEEDIYLISLIINSNLSNEYGIIVESR